MMSKHENIYTKIGLLLLAAALLITACNLWKDAKAGTAADTILKQLTPEIEKGDVINSSESMEGYYIPDYILNPEMDMPEKKFDGRQYIGVLSIPILSLKLPIISEWSYPNLQIAPCRYAGSVYLDNMVIAAHNYRSHFGYLKNLSQGDEIAFTDIDGNVFRYEVIEVETLSPFAIEEMKSGDWDLTLFTCTVGGANRITIRCEKIAK